MENEIVLIIVMVVLIGCIVCSYTDIRYGKISNKLIIALGLTTVSMNIAQVLYFNKDMYIFIINAFCLIVISVMLYGLHIWAGGDCKLMVVIALSLPMELYWKTGDVRISLWYIFLFIFSLGFVYVCGDSVFAIVKKENIINKRKIRDDFKGYVVRYVKIATYMAGIGHVLNYWISPVIQIPACLPIVLCLVIIFLYNKIPILYSTAIWVSVLTFDIGMTIYTGAFTINTLWYMYVLTFVFMGLRIIAMEFNCEEIATEEVKEGMIISRASSVMMQHSRIKGLPGVSDETLKSRLSPIEVQSIMRWGQSKGGCSKIVIVRKVPFAIFITIGLIMYLLVGRIMF